MRRSGLNRLLIFGVAMAVAVVLGTASPAHANLQFQIIVDGGAPTVFAAPSGGTASTGGSIVIGGITINGSANSNSPGAASQAFLVGSTLRLTVNDGLAHTVFVSVGDTGFTLPTGVQFSSSLGGTVFTTFAGATTLAYQSYIDTANGQNTAVGITPGPQTTFKSGSLASLGSFSLDDKSTLTGVLPTPYSMTSNYLLTIAAGNQGADLNLTTSATLSPVPEPATVAMALTGLPLVGLFLYRRRKV